MVTGVAVQQRFRKEFGRWLRAKRIAVGEIQLAFADRLGISPSQLARMESGYIPPKDALCEIAAAYGEAPEPWLEQAGYMTPGEDSPHDAHAQAICEAWAAVCADPDFGHGLRGAVDSLEAKVQVIRLYERVKRKKLLPDEVFP